MKNVPSTGGFHYPASRASRISGGEDLDIFLHWYWLHWEGWWKDPDKLVRTGGTKYQLFRFKLPWKKIKREYFREQSKRTLQECIKLGWIEENGLKIHVGKSIDAWSWWFPLLAFLQLCEKNKIAWAIILGLIAYSPLARPFWIQLLALLGIES